MADGNEREKALLKEIESLRRRVIELERSEEDRKRKEEKVGEHETIFLDLFNATEEAAFLMDHEGIILFANRNAARLYGLPMERLSGTSVYDHIPHDRIVSSKEKVKTVLETRKPVRFEGRLEEKVFENSLYPVIDDGAEVRRIAVYIRDITERKRLEAVLQRTREKFREIYENAMEGIFQISPDGRFVSANPSLAAIHGYDSPEEMINSVDDIPNRYVNPEDYSRLISLLFQQGSAENFETQMYRKDGSLHWISMNVRIVRDVQGKILHYEGTMMDITHRKRAEEALTESEERYRTAIEHSNDAVAIIQGEQESVCQQTIHGDLWLRQPEGPDR